MDEFLSQIIDELNRHKTPSVLVFISDHGEQLGEGGKWLHAQAGDAAKNPAYLMWFSKKYQRRYPQKSTGLNQPNSRCLYHRSCIL